MTDEETEAFYRRRTVTVAVNDAVMERSIYNRPKKKTAVRSTSKQSYKEEQPNLGAKQQELYDLLSKARRPVCDADLAKHLGWTNAIVSARRNELMDMGKVVEAGRAVYPPTGKTVQCWKAVL